MRQTSVITVPPAPNQAEGTNRAARSSLDNAVRRKPAARAYDSQPRRSTATEHGGAAAGGEA